MEITIRFSLPAELLFALLLATITIAITTFA